VDALNFGEWKAVVLTDASTEVDFLFHTNNKARKREAVLNTENKAGEYRTLGNGMLWSRLMPPPRSTSSSILTTRCTSARPCYTLQIGITSFETPPQKDNQLLLAGAAIV